MNISPQRPDYLSITTQSTMTFEDLDSALRSLKVARSTSYAVGVIYGSVCAPHLVPPSIYLQIIIGKKMVLPSPEIAERVLSLLYSFHKQMAELVEDNVPLQIRRSNCASDMTGLVQYAEDLWQEVAGFRKGLALGMETPEDYPEQGHRAYGVLAIAQNAVNANKRSIRSKRRPLTDEEIVERRVTLDHLGLKTHAAMQAIAQIIYQQRMNRYKVQGVVRIGRNDPCPCGSGKKFKQCCLDKINPTNIGNN